MIARKEENGKLKVTLFAGEIQGNGRYARLLDASPKTAKLALLKILHEAAALTGFAADYKNLTAEILIRQEGGCVIYYSCHQAQSTLHIQLDDLDTVTALLHQLATNGWQNCRCGLYAMARGYALLLHSPPRVERLMMLAGEYGESRFVTVVQTAWIQEYGLPVVEGLTVKEARLLLGA